MRAKVLVAESGSEVGTMIVDALAEPGWDIATRSSGRSALDALKAETFDVALIEMNLPDLDALELLRHARSQVAPPEVIMLAGSSDVDRAISAVRLGAHSYVSAPYYVTEVDVLVRRAYERRRLERENKSLRSRLAQIDADPEIVAQSSAMQTAVSLIEEVAPTESPVLISGDAGTGKSTFARLLHGKSRRASAPFFSVDCSVSPPSALESELFGQEKSTGAQSPAGKPRLGVIEIAAGGTICLEKVADLDQRVQARLARVLELGALFRVEGTQKVLTDIRVVATSSQNLANKVSNGSFRGDLYHAINTVSISLPKLRERLVDLRALAQHFVRASAGSHSVTLADDVELALRGYRWPGNLAELRAVMERALLLSKGGVIHAADIPLANALPRPLPDRGDESTATLEELERRHIAHILQRTNWHRSRAAEILGVSPKTLYRKIRGYGFRTPADAMALDRDESE